MRPADTSPEAWEKFLKKMRRLSPQEKLQRTLELSALARHIAEERLRAAYPRAGDREIFLRWARLSLGTELFGRVYGDVLPDDEAATAGLLDRAIAKADRYPL